MSWGPDELLAEVEDRLASGRGGWSAGVVGAIAEWASDGDTPIVRRDGRVVVASTPRGAIRLDTTGVAAFELSRRTSPDVVREIVFAVHRPIARPASDPGVRGLGPDLDALDPASVGVPLWELGLGRTVARFQVRTDDVDLTAALEATAGRPWTELIAAAGPTLLTVSPHRVVDTAAARVEVYAPIPPPGGRSPDGPHTHLLASHLHTRRDLARGVELPAGWMPVASHFPEP